MLHVGDVHFRLHVHLVTRCVDSILPMLPVSVMPLIIAVVERRKANDALALVQALVALRVPVQTCSKSGLPESSPVPPSTGTSTGSRSLHQCAADADPGGADTGGAEHGIIESEEAPGLSESPLPQRRVS